MTYLLDTNICIYILNQRPQKVIQRFRRFDPGDIRISAITISELQYGVSKSKYSRRNQDRLDDFLVPFDVLPYDAKAALVYGEIRSTLEQGGRPIGPLDLLIAAQAIAHHLKLVTNNTKEFERIDSLSIDNWAE